MLNLLVAVATGLPWYFSQIDRQGATVSTDDGQAGRAIRHRHRHQAAIEVQLSVAAAERRCGSS